MAITINPNKTFIKQAIFSAVGTAVNLSELDKESLIREAIRIGASKVLGLVQNEVREEQIYKSYIENPPIPVKKNSGIIQSNDIYSQSTYRSEIIGKASSFTDIQKSRSSREAYIMRYNLSKNGLLQPQINRIIDKIRIQFIPLELDYDPSANWVTIPTVGRNNPFYHYTGGEDILKFTLDWNSNQKDRKDVIGKCRAIEALTRNDAYTNEPPTLILSFGDLFKGSKWVLTSAPYRLSLFDNQSGLLPVQAYQEITLRRVTDKNRSWSDILGDQ